MCRLILTTAFSLFLLMDSVGNIPVYFALLNEIPLKKRLYIIVRENLIALVTILLFAYFGHFLMDALCIRKESMNIAGGVVLFLIAVKMILPEKGSLLDCFGGDSEPIIFPLAIPLIAGPSVLAAVMIYSSELRAPISLFLAIVIAWFCGAVILVAAGALQNFLGNRTIKALERLMGLILILIGVNMFLHGVKLYIQTLNTV